MKMASEVLLQLLFGLSCVALGFFAGLSLGWREFRVRGRTVAAPTLPRTERQQAYWLIVVAVLAVASTTFAAIQSSEQAECNVEFRETLVTRSAITSENQRHLDEMIATIADGIAAPSVDSQDRTRAAILDYQRWAIEAQQRRAASPLTDPRCGDVR